MPMAEWLSPRYPQREGYRKGFLEIMQKLSQMPTAVFCNNDNVAADILVACERKGLRVPEDISLVGFADEPISQILTPPLTTVHQDPNGIGKKGAQVLLERIEAKRQGEEVKNIGPEKIYLSTTLIKRNSVKRKI
jgi:LacI family transcriptional regulator